MKGSLSPNQFYRLTLHCLMRRFCFYPSNPLNVTFSSFFWRSQVAKNTAREHSARSKVPAAQPAHTTSRTLPGISPFPVITMIAPRTKTARRARERGTTKYRRVVSVNLLERINREPAIETAQIAVGTAVKRNRPLYGYSQQQNIGNRHPEEYCRCQHQRVFHHSGLHFFIYRPAGTGTNLLACAQTPTTVQLGIST